MGWVLSLLIMLLFYAVPLAALRLTDVKSFACFMRKREIVAIFLMSGVLLSIAMALIARERYIYFWDYGSYWYQTISFQNRLQSDGWDAMKILVQSIDTSEYNYLACAVIALPLKLFGNGYFAFVILNVVMFYIPNAFMMAFTFKKILEKHLLGKANVMWVYGYCLLFSVALLPILSGYVDIIAMLPLTTAYLLVIDRNFEQVDVAKDICLGISLLWIVWLRRYYAYAVVGEGVFTLFYWLTYGAKKSEPFYRFKNKLTDMLLSVAVPIIAICGIFRNFLMRSLFNNYLSAYSAYKSTDFVGEWCRFVRYFGMLFIAFMVVGTLYGIRKKSGWLTIGMLLGLIVNCVLFFRIQDMGQQHYYTVVFPMCFLIFLGIHALLSIYKIRTFFLRLVQGLVILVVAGNFFMSIGIGTEYKNVLWCGNSYTPRVRSDFKALQTLELCLEELSEEGHHLVYCTASSSILNREILYKMNAPDFNPRIEYVGVSNVDLRDGFSTRFFDADVVVACDPPQYHLAQGQEVILQLNEIMLSDNIVSDNYEVRGEYLLDNGVRALIYVKQKPLERLEIEYIRDIFEDIYPNHPELFSERINGFLNEKYFY